MNERIKSLAQQAGVIALSENDIAPPLKKFTELIINMCANEARNHTLRINGVSKDFTGKTTIELQIRKLYESDN